MDNINTINRIKRNNAIVVLSVVAFFIGIIVLAVHVVKDSNIGDNSRSSVQSLPGQIVDLRIVEGWKWEVDGNWLYIRGRVKNTGNVAIRYFEVHAQFQDVSGNVLAIDFTNSGETLNPDWCKEFEIMHISRPEYKFVSLRIENVRVVE
jgi:hypothetical protein